ncbi:MAG: hypothetical protein NWF09_08940, partial [Candidatus Bathyarchaeota archaeon]|nr:hypothetical protein [Candidatus Bathyarchaeota archaeon]
FWVCLLGEGSAFLVFEALGSVSSYADALVVFGERAFDAWQLVKRGAVKKYMFKPSGRVCWVVVGVGGEYLILDAAPYCGCMDFYEHVIDGDAYACKHLIAQRLAVLYGRFCVVEEEDALYSTLMEEWKWTVK